MFGAAAAAWHVGGQLLQPHQITMRPPPEDFAVQSVAFDSESGDRLAGWFHQGEPGRGVVVLAHGIRTHRGSSLARARLFGEHGLSSLLFDLRCHGESTGERVTLGWQERHDIRAAVDWAKHRCTGEPVAVVGYSLGGAAAALAAPLEVDAVVLEAVFPTIEAAVGNRTSGKLGIAGPLASWALLAQLEPRTGIAPSDLRPVDAVRRLTCPVMVVGGGRDQQTTPADTRRMFQAAPEPKELVWFDDLGHRNFARWAPEKYRREVVSFVTDCLSRAAADQDARTPAEPSR
ncbi:Alpha/beta hydrolase family protein [Posidoniimonas corsicana]|uniref:Alpha/beta hydrolase family protein n=1 Tax=Posidoniimonas corsicana TaxID=1938618 RepID=A0A5C5UVR5_9BACT|nr:alpha/beta fold hydrolase [Posidoniimonas corsicana]TWT30496.1 Alpha/beta hydrolase family protein [Posidoniimonas corsicana]